MSIVEKAHDILTAQGRHPINWEEVFLHFGSKLDKRTIIQIWLDHPTLALVVAAGYQAILSNQDVWYLDHLMVPWTDFYTNEPFLNITDPNQQAVRARSSTCTHFCTLAEAIVADFLVVLLLLLCTIVFAVRMQLILGGEVAMWGETVDTSDIFNTIWPRAAAAAERLWSPADVTDTTMALPRIERFRCLLNQRGIDANPVNTNNGRDPPYGPGSCYVQ
jgi:hexosaminidase